MVQVMVDQTIDSLAKKNRLSEGFLKINHGRIVESFKGAINHNAKSIEARVEEMVGQTKSSYVPFIFPGMRAQKVLRERVGEDRDLDVVEDIAVRFGQAVKEICKGDVAQKEAQRAVGGLSGARLGVEVSNPAATKVQEKGTRNR